MKCIRLGPKAERRELINRACIITEEKCREQQEKQRKHYTINSKDFSNILDDEDLGVLAKHPIGRG